MPDSFDVDIESSTLKKPYHYQKQRRRRLVIMLVMMMVLVLVVLRLFRTNAADHLAAVAEEKAASIDKHSSNNKHKVAVIEDEVDEVISKNSKAAAAAAAKIQYTDGSTGAKNKNLLTEDAVNAKPVQASKEMAAEQPKVDKTKTKPQAEDAKKVLAKGPSTSKNAKSDYSIYSTYDSKDDYGRTKFVPSAEFKAIVSLSPVVVFTWDKSNTLIPKDDEAKTKLSKRDTRYSSLHQSSSKDLLKTLWEHYQITPVPTYVALDRHPHFKELAIYINEMYHKLNDHSSAYSQSKDSKSKSRAESLLHDQKLDKREQTPIDKNIHGLPQLEKGENILPGIVIAGKPIGNARQFKIAHERGELLSILKDLGDGIFNVERAA